MRAEVNYFINVWSTGGELLWYLSGKIHDQLVRHSEDICPITLSGWCLSITYDGGIDVKLHRYACRGVPIKVAPFMDIIKCRP